VTISDIAVQVRVGSSLIVIGESSAQDVLAELGEPNSIYLKNKVCFHYPLFSALLKKVPLKTKIQFKDHVILMHVGTTTAGNATDYFYNYFGMGIDVMIDGATHVVKKMVLHTNLPNRSDFQEYSKCSFRIEWLTSSNAGTKGNSAAPPPPQNSLAERCVWSCSKTIK